MRPCCTTFRYRLRAGMSAAVVAAAAILLFAGPAVGPAAADTSVSEGSMTLTVSRSDDLPVDGSTITVSGSGYDESKGIYVAVCVDNGAGQTPTPCLGGVDMSGEAGGSAWISSNPPDYAEGLTTPFGPGGTFEVELAVVGVDPVTGTDCMAVGCAVVTRADHTRPSDRSLDVRIPITFTDAPAATTGPAEPSAPAASTGTSTKAGATKTTGPTTTAVASSATSAPTATASSSAAATTSPASPTSPSPSPSPSTSSSATATSTSTSVSSPPPTTTGSADVVAAAATTDDGGSGWVGWVIGAAALLVVLAGAGMWWSRRSGPTGPPTEGGAA